MNIKVQIIIFFRTVPPLEEIISGNSCFYKNYTLRIFINRKRAMAIAQRTKRNSKPGVDVGSAFISSMSILI